MALLRLTSALGACLGLASALEPNVFEAIVEQVNSQNGGWTAEVPSRFDTMEEVRRLCGTVLRGDPSFREPEAKKDDIVVAAAEIPKDFDVRAQWPKCASVSGHIRDQSTCGSCWAFGSTEALNDRRCILTGDTTLLSTEDTLSNCGFFKCLSMGCSGGQPGMAWSWFKNHGVVTGGDYSDRGTGRTCAPYSFPPCAHHVAPSPQYPTCSGELPTPSIGASCTESNYSKSYSADKKFASSSYSLNSVAGIQADIMQYGSVTGAFSVYADFPTYKSGVYSYVSGSMLGGHAIKIMGWGTEKGQDYWLVANSWNNQWGDKGTFKIKRGTNECGIEGQVSAGHAAPDSRMINLV